MNTKEPTLDEQIADAIEYFELHAQIHGEADPMMAAKLVSLQRLKAIDAVQVPEEPERIRSDYFLSEHRKVTDYIDTLRDLLRRETARADKLQKLHDLNWAQKECAVCGSVMASAGINSLERAEAAEAKLSAIDAVQVPEEPVRYGEDTNGEFGEWRNGEYVSYHDYDTLRDLLWLESAEKWDAAMAANIADEKRLDAERQLAAMLKLGAEPSKEMLRACKESTWIGSNYAAIAFKTMFAKLVEQSKEQAK